MGARRGWIRPAVPQSARPTFRRMSDPVLRDTFGRPLGSLRISVTDRCNMRCRYCMPEDEYVWLPRESILTFEEIARLVNRKSTRLNSSHGYISYAVFCLKKKNKVDLATAAK